MFSELFAPSFDWPWTMRIGSFLRTPTIDDDFMFFAQFGVPAAKLSGNDNVMQI